jgi:hypothetical protein
VLSLRRERVSGFAGPATTSAAGSKEPTAAGAGDGDDEDDPETFSSEVQLGSDSNILFKETAKLFLKDSEVGNTSVWLANACIGEMVRHKDGLCA